MVLGQEQDSLGGRFSELEALRGRMARLEMWNTTLDKTLDERDGTCRECNKIMTTHSTATSIFSKFFRRKCIDSPAFDAELQRCQGQCHYLG